MSATPDTTTETFGPVPPGLRAKLASRHGSDTLCLPVGQLRELLAEYDRRSPIEHRDQTGARDRAADWCVADDAEIVNVHTGEQLVSTFGDRDLAEYVVEAVNAYRLRGPGHLQAG